MKNLLTAKMSSQLYEMRLAAIYAVHTRTRPPEFQQFVLQLIHHVFKFEQDFGSRAAIQLHITWLWKVLDLKPLED